MRRLNKIILLAIFLLWTVVYGLSNTEAAVPHLINYQGRLTDSSGNPLNGSYNITFRIYDAETAGTLLWQEQHTGVVIQKGIFSILLGSVTALNLPFDTQYYLAIQVGSDPEMSPRQRITSAGYAIRAERAEGVNGITNFFPGSGNVGIGMTSPAEKLDVSGAIAINSKRIIDNSGNWVGNPTNLVGPAGPQGPQGPQGPAGSAVHTSASCGLSSCRGTDMAINACSILCNGAGRVVTAQCGSCTVTSDTGSCSATAENVCCVCRP
jgi:hypothetical protein